MLPGHAVLRYRTSAAATTSYTYDPEGNQTSVTDPDGNVTVFTFDANGNVLTTTTPLGQTTDQYDGDSNLLSTTDALGRTETYVYDANRLVAETWFNANGSVEDTQSYTYDPVGNMLTATNSAGTYTMSYDGNQLITRTDPNGITLTYSYDLNSNVIGVADSQGGLTTMTYNANNQVTSKTYEDSNTQLRVAYTYDLAGNLTGEARYSDVAGTQYQGGTVYGYDGGQLTSILQTDASGNTISSYIYAYNLAGQLTSETDNGVTTVYAYDPRGELTQAGSKTYTYDLAGNETGTGYVIGTDNELLADGTNDYV